MCEPIARPEIDPNGTPTQWVVDSIRFPTSAAEAITAGVNLDGDPVCRVDNALAQVFAATFGLFGDDNLNVSTAELVTTGRIIHLLELRATSLANAQGVGVRFYNGVDADDDATNNLGGEGVFTIEDSAIGVALAGSIEEGRLIAELGEVPLKLAFSTEQQPEIVMLHTAVVHATVQDNRLRGKIGGSFTNDQVQNELMPIAWAVLAGKVEDDCAGTVPDCCTPNSAGATVVGLWDTMPHDCQVTLDELRNSNVVRSLTTPDVDLYDREGRHNPLCDGAKDSLSFGVEFTAVPATF